MKHLLRHSAATMALIAAVTSPARAQFGNSIVFDPTNYSENVLTAARELQQVNNELQSLENQATSLVNQARNLASLPYSSLASLDNSIVGTEQLLAQAQGITYNVSAIDQAYSQTYPTSYSTGTSSEQLSADAHARWQNSLQGFQDAMNVQATAVQNLSNTHAEIDALVNASQSATGTLQASQTSNQLIALETTQLADLTAVMAATARAMDLESARQAEAEAQGQAQLSNFLDYGLGYQPGNAEMFH